MKCIKFSFVKKKITMTKKIIFGHVEIPCTQGGIQEILLCKGGILTKFFAGSNTKHIHFAGGKDFLTQSKNKKQRCQSLSIVRHPIYSNNSVVRNNLLDLKVL
jgi:hypothetical protein